MNTYILNKYEKEIKETKTPLETYDFNGIFHNLIIKNS